jgi:hypothetical protein
MAMGASALRRGALAAVAVLLLLGSGFSLVAGAPSAAPLSLTVPSDLGSVQNLGDQTYVVSGGQVAAAAVGGIPLDPGAQVTFSLNAEVEGARVSGSATFQLQGSVSGAPVSASGVVAITNSLTITQVGGPLANTACPKAGASVCGVLPVLFGGVAAIQVTTAGSTKHDLTVLYFENPYFNPFGKPIVMAAVDKAVVIVATYDVGTIQWQGSQVAGPVIGVLGTSTPAVGVLSLVSTESEDLVAGTAVDHGTVSLSSMSPSFLDVTGPYKGTSYIPAPGPQDDCSTLLGFPAGSGVCTITGFDSEGSFAMSGSPVLVVGSYITTWTTPALAFSSTITAVVVG